jgi:carboxyl-terminal processing protease
MEGISDRKIKKTMNELVDSLASRNGLIIDIRLNGGGYDKKGYLFAKYLTSSNKVAIYKHTRKPKSNDYKALKKHMIKASNKFNYTGPIVLITSDYTVSAADVFALALSDFQNVTIVGDRTAGYFSDVSTYKLPNGWKFALSTQKYYSHDMINYERIGVQPDYKTQWKPAKKVKTQC